MKESNITRPFPTTVASCLRRLKNLQRLARNGGLNLEKRNPALALMFPNLMVKQSGF